MSQYSFYAVMHFAGLKAVGESVEQPLKYYRVNLTGTINLLEVRNVSDIVNVFAWIIFMHGESIWIWFLKSRFSTVRGFFVHVSAFGSEGMPYWLWLCVCVWNWIRWCSLMGCVIWYSAVLPPSTETHRNSPLMSSIQRVAAPIPMARPSTSLRKLSGTSAQQRR